MTNETMKDGERAAKFAQDLRAEQTYLASCREMCSEEDELPRWDRLQRVIDYLESRASSPQSGEVDFSDGGARNAYYAGFKEGEASAAAPQAALTDEQRTAAARALHAAKHFIANGVALGFIRMPDADCPDPAKLTPKLIDDALALLATAPTERMSDAAVDAAIEAWFDCDDSNVNDHQARMRRAIIAATKEYS